MEISQYRLALSIGVPPRRNNEIVHEKRSISADTALRLGRFFGTSAEFWMNLQAHFDLETQKARLEDDLALVVAYSPGRARGTASVATRNTRYTATQQRARGAAAAARKAAKHK